MWSLRALALLGLSLTWSGAEGFGTLAASSSRGGARTAASSAATVCSGVLSSREVFGDVQVPPSRNCTINNTVVHGQVSVARGASLVVKASNIQGNVLAEAGFARLALTGAIVGGEVSAARGGSFNLDDSQVVGKVSLADNSGALRITRVTINGDLNCRGNRRAPSGSWIRVDGAQTGQCRRL